MNCILYTISVRGRLASGLLVPVSRELSSGNLGAKSIVGVEGGMDERTSTGDRVEVA